MSQLIASVCEEAGGPWPVKMQDACLSYILIIHSFITWIYIAPLQGYYSEALPTLAQLKTAGVRLE